MRHRNSGRKLGVNQTHTKAILRGLATNLIRHERITTTDARAKELRIVADNMITLAKRGDLHARRQAAAYLLEPEMVKKLFAELGPRFTERNGGYTRILKVGNRAGDNAPMSIIEYLADSAPVKKEAETNAGE